MDYNDNFSTDYRLSDAEKNIHRWWDNSLDPILTVESGDVVRFECRDPLDGQINIESTAEDYADAELDSIPPLTGPVAVEGANPGDVLAVELLEFQHKGWGHTGYWPSTMDVGVLPDEFSDAGLHIWDLKGDVGHFVDGIEIPLDPFPGTIGVAPNEDGEHETLPPRDVGGNMDIKHLTEGSTVFLPVKEAGALFSIGDCHAAQGDGEVCQTAIEAPMFVTAQFNVQKDMDITQPQFKTKHPFTATGSDESMYGTTGISDDLMDAARKSVSHMVEHLHEKRGLSQGEAYILCSVAVDLKINEIVDDPNWVVSAYLPESIFPQ